MSINVSSLEPIIIEPERSIRCDLLCKLRCTYSKGDITYVYNKKGNLHFKYEGNGSMDVYFNNSAYKLDRIYIGERRHKTYPNDPTIIGECTLIHKGRDNNLPKWNSWSNSGDKFLILDSQNDQGIIMSNFELKRIDEFKRLYADSRIKKDKTKSHISRFNSMVVHSCCSYNCNI